MKANELMIGDWVFIKDYPIRALPQRVRPEHYVRSLVEFEPIPITTEILKKNGFKREGGASYWHEGDRSACILHWSKDKEQLVVGSLCDDYMVKMNVRYVHELQHALRLCGIEKEIIL